MVSSTLDQLAAACETSSLHKIASARLAAIWLAQACAAERYRGAVGQEGLSELAAALDAHVRLYRAVVAAIPTADGDMPAALMWAHADVLAITRTAPDLTVGWLVGIRRVARADVVLAGLIREQSQKSPGLHSAAHLVAAIEESAREIDDQVERLRAVLGL